MAERKPGSRTILRASFNTLRANPRLMWFPILSAFAAMAIVGVGAAIAQLAGFVAGEFAGGSGIDLGLFSIFADPQPDPEATWSRGAIAGGLFAGLSLQLLSLIGSVALSLATMEALAGRPWTCRGAFAGAFGRLSAIATVAVIQLGVGRLLHGSRSAKNGKKKRGLLSALTAKFFEVAWWAAVYLVVPVLAREGRGGIASIMRSASLFKKTWKEAFVGRLTLGWAWFGVTVAAALPLAACALLGVERISVWFAAGGVSALILIFVVVFLATLDTVYRTALYVFATEGVVPEPFDQTELHEVFRVAR